MINPIESYQNAYKLFISATKDVTKIVDTILKAANDIKNQNWKTTMVSNSCPITFPKEIAENPASIDAETWPTGHQIASTLSQWHSAKLALHQTYQAIPKDQRARIQPPEE